ncbi:MAG: restriction endonuclease subunit S [Bacteroidales bacterium]|jgi:type I restriction enzyme S subunit
MIKNINIPKHWQVKILGEVCEIKSGKNQSKVINPNGKYPIYGSSGIFGYADEYICSEGTTIIGRKGTINSPIYVKTKFWNVDTAFGLCSKEGLNGKFLYYFCRGFNFHKLDKSTTIPSLSKRDLLSIDIPIPPLNEQLAIVSRIEELLSDLENGKQQLQTAQQQLEIYRQSLLKWAFEGKLTNKKIIDNELPKGWKVVELKTVTSILGDGLHGTPKYSDNGEYYFINGNNLCDGKIILKTETRRVSSEEYEKYKKPLNDNTILVSINGTLGNIAFYNNEKVILGKSACFFNVLRDIDKNYVRLLLTGQQFQNYTHNNATGSTIKNVSLKSMREFRFPLPSFEEQGQIVQKLESKLTVCDKIEETISQSLHQVETLKQSILKKAFEGKLG